ncbi:hydroxyacid-oxoacid transhydrogenase, partial [Salmonella enterica]|nr:hydroxyacid-oxoacid transhydrogenase [Salmonella enterica]
SGVAFKERLAMPVVAELVAREQPEHLREYFWARLEVSAQLPDKNAPEYARNEDDVKK